MTVSQQPPIATGSAHQVLKTIASVRKEKMPIRKWLKMALGMLLAVALIVLFLYVVWRLTHSAARSSAPVSEIHVLRQPSVRCVLVA